LRIGVLSAFFLINLNAQDKVDLKKLKADFKREKVIPFLESNPYSKEKEHLGKMLFFDPRLSGSSSMSCASCHNPSFAWGDSLPKAVGNEHKVLARKTPTILNLAWTEKMMWDGRFTHFEGQAMGPIGSPNEMNMDVTKLVEKIKNIEGYKELFEKAFPGKEMSNELIANALSIFQRKVVSADAPFDLWIKGKENAISESAKKGFILYNTKANCVTCHAGWRFTDDSFHDVGLNSEDIGRGQYLKIKSQQFAFKTPGLRNITLRGPYMHDGSKQTLKEVIEFYNKGGEVKRPSLSAMIFPLGLTDEEINQLEEFLFTLTSQDPKVELPILPRSSIK